MTDRRPLFLQSVSRDPDYSGMVRDHARRHQTYCAHHGYAYLALPNPEVTLNGFFRLRMILEQMQTGLYSHVWWIDADAFVADLSRDMRETTPAGSWLGMTIHPYPWGPEVFHLQCGMFYFRCTQTAMAFIRRVLSFEHSGEDDQTVINRLMLHDAFSPIWQRGLYILDSAWNNTLHDQPNRPIVAAFHGYLSPAERRADRDGESRNPLPLHGGHAHAEAESNPEHDRAERIRRPDAEPHIVPQTSSALRFRLRHRRWREQ